MKLALPLVLVALGLGACGTPTPDSRAADSGVGFGDYLDYERQRYERNAALAGDGDGASAPAVSLEEVGASGEPVITTNNPGISDENSFEAVSGRETIESDAERLAAQREAYEVIEPTAVPDRPSNERPNIVQYALGTHHPVGQKIWDRPSSTSDARFRRSCAQYPTADLAQEDFLAKGGPRRDPRGMDPDGDGYACLWDPTPFRAVQAQN